MFQKRISSLLLLALAFSSCATLQKSMHPSRYCHEKGCHRKRMPDSNYCERHDTLKMEEIVRQAEQVKREYEATENKP